jgi:hypothetical protein
MRPGIGIEGLTVDAEDREEPLNGLVGGTPAHHGVARLDQILHPPLAPRLHGQPGQILT